jgi:hypothetical protein
MAVSWNRTQTNAIAGRMTTALAIAKYLRIPNLRGFFGFSIPDHRMPCREVEPRFFCLGRCPASEGRNGARLN